MSNDSRDIITRNVTICLDALVATVSFLWAWAGNPCFGAAGPNLIVNPFTRSGYVLFLFFCVTVVCLMLYFNGVYRTSLRIQQVSEIARKIIKSVVFSGITLGLTAFAFDFKDFSRVHLAFFLAACMLFLFLEKVLLYLALTFSSRDGFNAKCLLLVGTGRRVVHFIDRVKAHPEWGLKVNGIIDDEHGHLGEKIKDIEVVGGLEDISRIVKKHNIDEVIFMVPRTRLNYIENAVYLCQIQGVKASIALDLFDFKLAKSRQSELDGIPFMSFEAAPSREWELFIKRALDMSFSFIGIVALSPLLITLMLLIKFSSKGRVFFLQKRIGLNGQKFILYKFRTIYDNLVKRSHAPAQVSFSGFKADKGTLTPLGKLLVFFQLDKLPQLFNVLLGSMSMVGPMAAVPRDVIQYEPWQMRRLSMRPGITGLSQLGSGARMQDTEEVMRQDIFYVDNWSLWLDLKIVLRSLPQFLLGRTS